MREFQSLVGSLLWVVRGTRPHIVFAVYRLRGRRTRRDCWTGILQKSYRATPKGTATMKIAMASVLYSGAMPQLEGTSDADFAADKTSTTGGLLRLNSMEVI